MYELLARQMYVTDVSGAPTSVPNVSRTIEMEGSNAVRVEMTVFALTLDPITVNYYVSDDDENWAYLTQQTGIGYGYTLLNAVTGIKAKFLRLRPFIELPGSTGIAIVGFGINKSVQ
jgi:hypothetical protein